MESDMEFECDACGLSVSSQAIRFRCLLCRDFDLCAGCNDACLSGNLTVADHDSSHPMYAANSRVGSAPTAGTASSPSSRPPVDPHLDAAGDPGKLAALCKAALEGAGLSAERLGLATGLEVDPETAEFRAFHRFLGGLAAEGPLRRSARGGLLPSLACESSPDLLADSRGTHNNRDASPNPCTAGPECLAHLCSLWEDGEGEAIGAQTTLQVDRLDPECSCAESPARVVQRSDVGDADELNVGKPLCSLTSSTHLGGNASSRPSAAFWVQNRFAGDVQSVAFPEAELLANRDKDAAGARTIDLLLAGDCSQDSTASGACPAPFAGVAPLAPGKWRSQIWVEGRVRTIGSFASDVSAAEAHDCAIRLATAMWWHLRGPEMHGETHPLPIERLRDSWLARQAESLAPSAAAEIRTTASSMICPATGRQIEPLDELNFSVANAAIRQRLETAEASEFLHYQVLTTKSAASTREAADWFGTGLSPAADADHPAPATSSWGAMGIADATTALSAIALGESWVAAGRERSGAVDMFQHHLGSWAVEGDEPPGGWTAAAQARAGVVASAWSRALQGPTPVAALPPRDLKPAPETLTLPLHASGMDGQRLLEASKPAPQADPGASVVLPYQMEGCGDACGVASGTPSWVQELAKLTLAKLLAEPTVSDAHKGVRLVLETPGPPQAYTAAQGRSIMAELPEGDDIDFVVRAAASRGIIPLPVADIASAAGSAVDWFPGGLHPRTSALVPCLRLTMSRLGHTAASGAALVGCKQASLAAWLERRAQPWSEFHDICDRASSLLRLCRRRSGFAVAKRKHGNSASRLPSLRGTRSSTVGHLYGFDGARHPEATISDSPVSAADRIGDAASRWRIAASKPAATLRPKKRRAASRPQLIPRHQPTLVFCNGAEQQMQPGLPGEADDASTVPAVCETDAMASTMEALERPCSPTEAKALARVLFADYARCTVCGLSGDFDSSETGSSVVKTLKCSDCGCVVHAQCYLLTDNPSGKWTCQVCTGHGLPTESEMALYRPATAQAIASPAGCAVCHLPPRGLACKPCSGESSARWAHVVCLLASNRARTTGSGHPSERWTLEDGAASPMTSSVRHGTIACLFLKSVPSLRQLA